MEKILIVEDELIVARDIRKTLERNGYKVAGVSRSTEKALLMIEDERPSFVLVDIFLKGKLTGVDLATKLNEENIPFIYISANSNQAILEAAKSTNPYGFIVKPFRERDLLVTIEIARYRHENSRQMKLSIPVASATEFPVRQSENTDISRVSKNHMNHAFSGIIGKSSAMMNVFSQIEQVAPFDTSVLLLGESGTGKEGIANAIVQQSRRANKPFVKINCAAIPSGLMEAELFGYEKGAFTGALERKSGKFELASGGSLLLDEIGEMPMDMQAKLLRVLQEKEVQRIGSNITIKTDVRVLAATSRNLEKEVAEGRFRLDLYYRLQVFPISLPPLRERKEDIPLLANHFMHYYAEKTGKRITMIEEMALDSLLRYHWPGNVRELQHLVERSVLLAKDEKIREMQLPNDLSSMTGSAKNNPDFITADESEKQHILSVLKHCNFRVAGKGGAAEILDIPPTTLFSRMKKLGIKKVRE